MVGIYLSSEEMEALLFAPPLAQRLYVFGIRPSMDFQSGLVGASTPVSWDGLRRELIVEGAPGIREERPGKQQLRRAAQHLVRRGLIRERSSKTRLIFECLQARLDSSVQNKADSKPTGFADRKPTASRQATAPGCRGLEGTVTHKAGIEADRAEGEKPTHVRGSENYSLLPHARDRFSMFADWQPSPTFSVLCLRAGVSPEDSLVDQSMMNFVAHHLASPGRCESQARWEALLLRWVQGDKARSEGAKKMPVTAARNQRAVVTEAVMDIENVDW